MLWHILTLKWVIGSFIEIYSTIIIIKTKFDLPKVQVTLADFDYPVCDLWSWLSCLWPLILTILFMTFDLDYPVYDLWSWLSYLWPLVFLLLKIIKLFVFLMCWLWTYLKVILEICCVQSKFDIYVLTSPDPKVHVRYFHCYFISKRVLKGTQFPKLCVFER